MAVRRLNAQARTPHVLRSGPVAPQQPPTFNGALANLYEEVGDGPTEVSKAGFSTEGGKSQRAWQATPASIEDLVSVFPAILGYTKYSESGTGKLVRTLPLADPLYPWMYASSISTVEGYGTATQTAADPQLEAPAFPYGAFWQRYRLSVESMPRPFPVLPDYLIPTIGENWYPETGGGTTKVPFKYATEQNRFCTWEFQPEADYVTMQRGSMVFNSSVFGSAMSLNAMPRIYLPNQRLTVTWYNVPLRLAISGKSYLQRWLGRINQNPVAGPDGIVFPKGSLLYLNFSTKTFTPPQQDIVPLGGPGGNIVSTDKFVNITMNFLYTTRTLTGTVTTAPTNLNFVTAGHNLLPWIDGNFYYAQMPTITTGPYTPPYQNQPTWLSAPLESLWTDCDSGVGP